MHIFKSVPDVSFARKIARFDLSYKLRTVPFIPLLRESRRKTPEYAATAAVNIDVAQNGRVLLL